LAARGVMLCKEAMRKLLVLFAGACVILLTGGCISKNTEKFQAQVKKWVPIGMKESKAQHLMEKKGFECNIVRHDSVFNTNDVDWLDCTREQVWFHDWQARILLKDSKVVGYGPAEVK
jgi:hypothetical protein